MISFFSVSLTESKLHGLELSFCKFCFFMSNSVLVCSNEHFACVWLYMVVLYGEKWLIALLSCEIANFLIIYLRL